MRLSDYSDRFLPQQIIDSGGDIYRRSTLVVYAVGLATLTAFPVALVLLLEGNLESAGIVTLGVLPTLLTLWILNRFQSVFVAGNYLAALVFLQIALDFSEQKAFSIIAIFGLPVIGTALVSIRSGVAWSLIGMAWGSWVGFGMPPSEPVVFGLIWCSVVILGVLGVGVVVMEKSRNDFQVAAETAQRESYSQRERLRAFAANAFPVLVETEGTRLLYASEGLTAEIGYDVKDFVSRPPADYIHPHDLEHLTRQLSQQGAQGLRREIRVRHRDGRWLWFELFAIPSGPDSQRWIFAARNIEQERKQREESEQAHRLESVGVLAAGVAHDFNNLLAVTLGFAELLPDSLEKREIINATTQSAKLTRQLLSFSKSDQASQLGLDLADSLEDMRPILQGILGPGASLQINTAGLPPSAAAISSGHFHQIMVNLLSNAAAAVGDDGVVTVTLGKVASSEGADIEPGEYAEVTVLDNGSGMDEHSLRHAFDPFYSTKPVGQGSGLGLASVYGIVKNTRGYIWLDSQYGAGTKVRILLPLLSVVSGVIDEPMEFENPQPVVHPLRGVQTILLVEDDLRIRSLLKQTLERAGYLVESARGANEALALLKVLEPDLIVCDIVMQGMSGPQLVDRVRQQRPDMKVVFVSGQAEASLSTVNDHPQTRFLAKPFRASQLLRLCVELLDGRVYDPPQDELSA